MPHLTIVNTQLLLLVASTFGGAIFLPPYAHEQLHLLSLLYIFCCLEIFSYVVIHSEVHVSCTKFLLLGLFPCVIRFL